MTDIKRIFGLLILLIFSTSLLSQNGEYVTVRDLETWSSLNLKYKVSKKWDLRLEQQFRFNDNSGNLDTYFSEFSTNLDFNDYIFGGFGLRYIKQNDDVGKIQGFENHLRLHFDLGVKHKIKRFDFEYRLRFQNKNELGIGKEEGDYPNKNLRLKVGLGYNFKDWKLDPVISGEIFRHYEEREQTEFNKFRLTLGTRYKTEKLGKIAVFYRMEKELQVSYPKTSNILGVKYTYTLKNKKK